MNEPIQPAAPAAQEPSAQPVERPDAESLNLLRASGMFNPDGSIRQGQVAQPVPVPVAVPVAQPVPVPAAVPVAQPQDPPADPAASLARALAMASSAPQSAPPGQAPEIPEAAPGRGDPKANHEWATLRARAKAAEAKAAEIEAKVREAEAEKARISNELAEKLKEQQQRAEELEDRIGRVSLENSPKFRERYASEFGALTGKLASTLSRYAGVGKDEALDQARQLLQASPADLVAMTKKLDPAVGSAVISMSAEAQALFERRQMEIDQWREVTAAQARDEAREGLVATVTQRREMADAAIEAARSGGVSIYDLSTPELAQHASKAIEEFRGFAQTATPDDLMRLAAVGHAMPAYLESLEWHAKRVAELEAVLAGRRYANAIPAGPHVPPPPPPPAAVDPALEQISDPKAFARAAVGGILRDAFTGGR